MGVFSYYLACIYFVLREDEELTAILQFIDGIGKSSSAFHCDHGTIGTAFDFSLVRLISLKRCAMIASTGRSSQYVGTKTDDTT